jgi:hypothetical protein
MNISDDKVISLDSLRNLYLTDRTYVNDHIESF